MQQPQTALINGLTMAAVSPGCCPFPAKYPEIWTLHLMVVEAMHNGLKRTHRAVRGTDARFLNDFAAAAHEHDLAVFAWVATADDQTVAA